MSHKLNFFYENVIKYDLINKFLFSDINEIPKLKKIVLNFGCKSNELKSVASALLALEFITTKKGKLVQSKRSHIQLKIRKGNPVGCMVILNKKNVMYLFLFRILNEILPNLKNFKSFINLKIKFKYNSMPFTLKELIVLPELENYFYLFSRLPSLNITLVTHTKTKQELIFLLSSFKIPFQKLKNSNCNSIGRV